MTSIIWSSFSSSSSAILAYISFSAAIFFSSSSWNLNSGFRSFSSFHRLMLCGKSFSSFSPGHRISAVSRLLYQPRINSIVSESIPARVSRSPSMRVSGSSIHVSRSRITAPNTRSAFAVIKCCFLSTFSRSPRIARPSFSPSATVPSRVPSSIPFTSILTFAQRQTSAFTSSRTLPGRAVYHTDRQTPSKLTPSRKAITNGSETSDIFSQSIHSGSSPSARCPTALLSRDWQCRMSASCMSMSSSSSS